MNDLMKNSNIPWIGEIPNSWNVVPCDTIGVVQAGYPFDSNQFSSTDGFPLIRIRDITSGETETFYKGEYPEEYIVNNGDLLIGMDGDFRTRWWTSNPGLLNQRCCRLIIKDDIIRKFVYYQIPSTLKIINDLKYSTTVKHLANEDVSKMKLFIPGIENCKAIVTYLDSKCMKIDALIDAQQQMIARLEELKQSTITDAVTKGLDPTVEMKDSGVPWIGMTPLNWAVEQMKSNFVIQKRIAGKLGYDVLSVTQNGLKIKDVKSNEGQLAMDYSKYQLVFEGDYVMNHMDLLTGYVDRSKYNGVTSPDYRVFTLISENLDPDYALLLLQNAYHNKIFYGLGQGVSTLGRWRLPRENFMNFYIQIPPLDEQRNIVDYVNERISHYDSLIDVMTEHVNKLVEYKQSLIYEYVTGKKQVPQEA